MKKLADYCIRLTIITVIAAVAAILVTATANIGFMNALIVSLIIQLLAVCVRIELAVVKEDDE